MTTEEVIIRLHSRIVPVMITPTTAAEKMHWAAIRALNLDLTYAIDKLKELEDKVKFFSDDATMLRDRIEEMERQGKIHRI